MNGGSKLLRHSELLFKAVFWLLLLVQHISPDGRKMTSNPPNMLALWPSLELSLFAGVYSSA
jgi:hypothetical protein